MHCLNSSPAFKVVQQRDKDTANNIQVQSECTTRTDKTADASVTSSPPVSVFRGIEAGPDSCQVIVNTSGGNMIVEGVTAGAGSMQCIGQMSVEMLRYLWKHSKSK